MPAELRVDPVLCDGHAICAFLVHERIDVDAWGYPVVDRTLIDDDRTMARARRAVRACPRQALVLIERPNEPRAASVGP